ncbi:helix-turn-helix transcriptional regulator [Ornithinimicrobium panacihumi]|uniref:helix-turn-helix transcriptional regulator n=1 Tax=Ornithinimicrobium panacihumi TaxID=2008449 RepID=UPI003F895438
MSSPRPWHGLPDAAALLSSPVRRALVDELAALDPQGRGLGLTAAELGDRLQLHPTTIRFHVDRLVSGGVLESHFARGGGVGRPSKRYTLREVPLEETAATVDQGADAPFGMLAGVLASALSVQEAAPLTPEQAGVRWVERRVGEGRVAADDASPVDQVVELLGDWGYTPETGSVEEGAAADDDGSGDGSGEAVGTPVGSSDILLRDCPFIELAHTHPDVVCGMHRGLLRGALDAVGLPDAQVSLQPFAGPDFCRARITGIPHGEST